MIRRAVVLDANILIRFALGTQVPRLITDHAGSIDFLAPDTAFAEARRHLPTIVQWVRRGQTADSALAAVEAAADLIAAVPSSSYAPFQEQALARIAHRDPEDWPVLACALLLDCPIWTEDRDFFGTGVATWITSLVDQYFAASEGHGRA